VGAPATVESPPPPQEKMGLVNWNGLHLMKESLGTSDLMEGATGAAGK
jgi:hypothetical protein